VSFRDLLVVVFPVTLLNIKNGLSGAWKKRNPLCKRRYNFLQGCSERNCRVYQEENPRRWL